MFELIFCRMNEKKHRTSMALHMHPSKRMMENKNGCTRAPVPEDSSARCAAQFTLHLRMVKVCAIQTLKLGSDRRLYTSQSTGDGRSKTVGTNESIKMPIPSQAAGLVIALWSINGASLEMEAITPETIGSTLGKSGPGTSEHELTAIGEPCLESTEP